MFGDRPSLLNDPNHFVDIQKKGRKNLRHIFRLTIVRLRRRSVLNRRQRCESMTLLTNSFRLIISATTTTHSLSPLPAKLLETRVTDWLGASRPGPMVRLVFRLRQALQRSKPTQTNSLALGQTQALGPRQGCIVHLARLGLTRS